MYLDSQPTPHHRDMDRSHDFQTFRLHAPVLRFEMALFRELRDSGTLLLRTGAT